MFEGDHSDRSAEKQKAQNLLGHLLTITLITHLATLLIWTPREKTSISFTRLCFLHSPSPFPQI